MNLGKCLWCQNGIWEATQLCALRWNLRCSVCNRTEEVKTVWVAFHFQSLGSRFHSGKGGPVPDVDTQDLISEPGYSLNL